MFFENVLPVAYLGIGAACALAVLLTAVMFLLKKKSGKVLGLYGLCVALLLGCGFLASNDSPFPQPLINTPEVDYSQSSRGPTPSYIQQIQQQHQPVLENDAPAEDDIDIESIITPEPEPEPAPEEADYAEDPPAAVSPTTVKVSSSSTGGNTTKAASGDTSTASKADAAAATTPAPQPTPLSLDDNPTLAPDPVLAPMPDRELAPDPVLSTVSNPTLVDDTYPSYTSTSPQGSSQNNAGSSSGGDSGSSDSSSSKTYMHDFSNGRVLATAASNNNGDPVYHTKDCSAAVKIPDEDSIWYDSEEAAKNAGRRLCKRCGG